MSNMWLIKGCFFLEFAVTVCGIKESKNDSLWCKLLILNYFENIKLNSTISI